MSPEEVQHLIKNINKADGLFQSFAFDSPKKLEAKPIPYFGNGPANPSDEDCEGNSSPVNCPWLGAQATVQRWYADPILDNAGFDRTLRTIFTHDHFSPSTHQQVGLYAGLLVEPEGSKWQNPLDDNIFFGTNLDRPAGADGNPPNDGGPTSWQANIITSDEKDSYREFALEFQDRQLAYERKSRTTPRSSTRNTRMGHARLGCLRCHPGAGSILIPSTQQTRPGPSRATPALSRRTQA